MPDLHYTIVGASISDPVGPISVAPGASPPVPPPPASYFNVNVDGHAAENAVWSYEQPFPAVTEIRERLAFYPNKVRIEEIAD